MKYERRHRSCRTDRISEGRWTKMTGLSREGRITWIPPRRLQCRYWGQKFIANSVRDFRRRKRATIRKPKVWS